MDLFRKMRKSGITGSAWSFLGNYKTFFSYFDAWKIPWLIVPQFFIIIYWSLTKFTSIKHLQMENSQKMLSWSCFNKWCLIEKKLSKMTQNIFMVNGSTVFKKSYNSLECDLKTQLLYSCYLLSWLLHHRLPYFLS